MDSETIDYQRIIQDSLRGVVRRVLTQVVEHGLPGEHHFYIGFRTSHPGVEVPRFLRDQYPEEMTIILQHQFWELEVDEEAFSVVLSFGGSRHRLRIPFAALTAFADPEAQFALRFAEASPAAPPVEPEPVADEDSAEDAQAAGKGEVLRFDPSRKR
ncbi:MAG TPA: ClpXP protease specificity-enhancing factor SspB [Thermoanaerobaculia bacterium]|nr:ClpXP protease specificity-enhancing factor SspB [Thermoanaerobaculia bacterium]